VTTPGELEAHTEARLAEVFQAPVRIRLAGDLRATDFEVAETVDIPPYTHAGGTIRMGTRANHTPYFRHDVTLLRALAEVFSYMLANLQLQERKQEQDKRERELVLNASRSELKALRAQINPHFLFNALNTIAGLIPSDPEKAETTVEQLAEVFRYTLSRSEAEWTRIEDELEFVRSYLDVEQARFGDRLQVSLKIDSRLRDRRIPAMMIQTLVENAVKHGLGAVKGRGRIGVEVAQDHGSIQIHVSDNGPGPQAQQAGVAGGPEQKGAGYGLKNIRSRLAGYYGNEASVELARNEADGLTVARLKLPLEPSRQAERGDSS
jgi:two-component system LytT family sensor kinase